MDEEREFRNVFARQNLSLMVENAANKTIVFASSFDGKTLPSNLTFEAYSLSNSSGKQEFNSLGAIKAKWIAKSNTYEISKIDGMLVAKNASYF